MKTKHTIEIEIDWTYKFPVIKLSEEYLHFATSEDKLKLALGITKPKPPYEPKVGDIVRYITTGQLKIIQSVHKGPNHLVVYFENNS